MTNWGTDITDWTRYLRGIGRAPLTIRARQHHLWMLARARPDLDPRHATLDDLTGWMAEHQHWQPESRASARASLVGFYRWQVTTARMATSPAEHLPPVRIPPTVARPTPPSAAAAALAAADDDVRLMVALARYAGLRRAEIAHLHSDDIDDEAEQLRVTLKGRTRVVPIHPVLLPMLAGRRGWVFPSPVRAGLPVTEDHVGRRLSRVLPATYSGHSLRHRAGSDFYLASGRDLLVTQRLLGHARPETTQRYVQVDAEDLRRAVHGVMAS